MNNHKLIQKLQNQSTWKLYWLSVITLGIYSAYYIKKQTLKLNDSINDNDKIPYTPINIILVLSYIHAILIPIHIIFIRNNTVDIIQALISYISYIMIVVWGFKARNRLNKYCSINKCSTHWFHGLWSFLFTPLYFNYKINSNYEYIVNKNIEENLDFETVIKESKDTYKISFKSDNIIWQKLKDELKDFYKEYQFSNIISDKENSWMIKSDTYKESYINLSREKNIITLEVYNIIKPNIEIIDEILDKKYNKP